MKENNRIIQIFLISIVSLLMIFSCGDTYMGIEPIKTDSSKPLKITVNDVIPKPGALEIHFSIPKGNENIAQVVASYINKKGKKFEFKVSRYTTSILVEGMTGEEKGNVELVCVDNSGNESDVTYVKDAPLISPVELALKHMKVKPTFGGVRVEWVNPAGASLAIHTLTPDFLDKYGPATLQEDPTKVIYSSDSIKTYAFIRHYPAKEQQFGFIVSDKWENRSDTLISLLTPFQEDHVDYEHIKPLSVFNYGNFKGVRDYIEYGLDPITGIQNDGNYHDTRWYGPSHLFDGIKQSNQQMFLYKYVKNLADGDATTNEIVQSAYSTHDLNVDVILNRIQVWPREYSHHYEQTSPKRFRFWGTNDANNDRFNKFPETWTLIGEYVAREPADPDNWTTDEVDYHLNHQEYSIEEDNVNPDATPTASFRYLRIEFMETFEPTEVCYTTDEIDLYGQIQKKYY